MSRIVIVAIVVAMLVPAATAQQPAQPVFRSGTRLIVQTVSVTDREGRPIEGLGADDFVVTEDGERQDIAFVEYQRLDAPPATPVDAALAAPVQTPSNPAAAAAAPAPAAAAPAADRPPASDVPSTVQAGFAPRTPGDERFRNRRLLVLYFDLTATAPPDQMRA